MSTHDNGGQAFPSSKIVGDYGNYGLEPVDGMTMRDYFAAKAMLTVFCPGGPLNEWPKEREIEDCAARCYVIADALLKARQA